MLFGFLKRLSTIRLNHSVQIKIRISKQTLFCSVWIFRNTSKSNSVNQHLASPLVKLLFGLIFLGFSNFSSECFVRQQARHRAYVSIRILFVEKKLDWKAVRRTGPKDIYQTSGNIVFCKRIELQYFQLFSFKFQFFWTFFCSFCKSHSFFAQCGAWALEQQPYLKIIKKSPFYLLYAKFKTENKQLISNRSKSTNKWPGHSKAIFTVVQKEKFWCKQINHA